MVMTGWLPSHSIETPLDSEKAAGKAEIMRNRVLSTATRDLVWALIQSDSNFYMTDDVLKFALGMNDMPDPAVVSKLQQNRSFVAQLVQRRTPRDFDRTFNKDKLIEALEQHVEGFKRISSFYNKRDEVVPPQAVVSMAMGDFELFVTWTKRVIEMIFDGIFSDTPSEAITLEVLNFDVPTERDMLVSVITDDATYYKFNIPWYGRQVIQHDVNAFLMLAVVSIAKDLEE